MKKLSLLVGGVILSTAVMAQKPADGAPMSLEGQLSLTGMGTGGGLDFAAPSLRFRYWVTENIAARVTLGINSTTTTDNFYENEADNSGDAGVYEEKVATTNFAIGGEYHFAGTDRLSPYVGLDISMMSGSVTESADNAEAGGWVAADYTREFEGKMGGFGVGLVAGTDFYFAENFYLGLELGWGWMSTTVKESTETTNPGGGATAVTVTGNESKTSTLANSAISAFRLGWRF